MNQTTMTRNKLVTELLNGTLLSLKTVVHIDYKPSKPQLLDKEFLLSFGVLIGITGDIKGKLVLSGNSTTFQSLGEIMYGMPLEDEMLLSFSGELGNMIAGGLSTNIAENGIRVNITAPTIMQGTTTISGYKQALDLPITFENTNQMNIY